MQESRAQGLAPPLESHVSQQHLYLEKPRLADIEYNVGEEQKLAK